MPTDAPATTVVVVTWRGADHITECLDGLAAQHSPHRTLVVDNASDDGTATLLARHPSRPAVLRPRRNLGYAGALAAALPHVTTPFVAWLNDDAVPRPAWLNTLEDILRADPGCAAVASVLQRPDGTRQSSGVRLTADGHGADLAGAPSPTAPPFGFCGGAVLLRLAPLRAEGGVPAGFFCYYEDLDTAWRLRLAGHGIAAPPDRPDAAVVHRHGASTRPGSPRFHGWNERNRLLTLLRCAPAAVAVRELARFAALTAVLPLRRARPGSGTAVPDAPNFRVGLRCRVLAGVVIRLPGTLARRVVVGRHRVLARSDVWRRWAGK
ncbi:glycosyl transferase [Saccharomonospora piscinae]|uniref:Glycosyl transferase n=1 Tax=Saccharomonospora piscinae TaxID=687388 RepID=A0A1V8ZZN6_SACPI|nr:glycosyltransferase [Saccharomonospora piscinae]OQO90213.1 glycosyl transferase [Saccharomonospora piscinae]